MEKIYLDFDSDAGKLLLDALEITNPICEYCRKRLKPNEIGGLLPPGKIIICRSMVCYAEWSCKHGEDMGE